MFNCNHIEIVMVLEHIHKVGFDARHEPHLELVKLCMNGDTWLIKHKLECGITL